MYMMRRLSDLCIQSVCFGLAKNLPLLNLRSQRNLPAALQQRILQAIIDKDLLVPTLLPVITYNTLTHNLSTLFIYGSVQLDDTLLSHLALCGCQLLSLTLIRCPRITDRGLVELIVVQQRLRCLQLRHLTINGACLTKLNTLHLRRLVLKGCASVVPSYFMQALAASSGSVIEYLNVGGLRQLTDHAVVLVLESVGPNLRYINFSGCLNLTDQTLVTIAAVCLQLETLKLCECMNFTEPMIVQLLRRCQQLKILDLSFCTRTEPLSIETFSTISKQLICLKLYGISTVATKEQFISALAHLQNIEVLCLNGFSILDDSLLQMLLLQVGDRLIELDLSGSFAQVADGGIAAIAKYCARLERIGLSLLSQVTGITLLPMLENRERAAKLTCFRAASCIALDVRVWWALCSYCVNLELLDASFAPSIDNHMLDTLASYTTGKLRSVFLKGSRLLSDSGISALLSRSPQLLSLCLSGLAGVTDRTILNLASHCHHLQELYLSGCMFVSQQAIQYLKDCCVGRLSVYHINPNVPNNTVVAKNLDTGQFVRVYSSLSI